MDEFDAAMGITDPDPKQLLARALTAADYGWIRQLIEVRKRKGLSQADLGKLMGRSQSVVSDIESMSGDPRLSTLRRYALAVGANVEHVVEDADLEAAIKLPRRIHRMSKTAVSHHRAAVGTSLATGWNTVKVHVAASVQILQEPVIAGA
ncbi:helix-turn-helix transcriptional regulator [Actinophytocola oryzae]|uniref:helix-turn-helix transcriptional regulator n=1 Tax=Actinophytocola oryzae TaxID=502181 RepID=UPI00106332F2|nr:helix-turn-helix transcriptional regulator [Actinophytocola oryzae]